MCKTTTTSMIPPGKAISASKSRRVVRFGKVSAKLFHQPLSRTEKKVIWYSGSDYRAMNREVRHNLKREMVYGFNPHDEGRSWRGLEHIREGVPNAKLERRRYFVRSFLHVHKTLGVKDSEDLAALASVHSNVDQIRALAFAEYDAYEAACVYQERDYYDKWYPLSPSESWDSAYSSHDDYYAEDQAENYKEFCNIPRTTSPKPTQTIIMARTA